MRGDGSEQQLVGPLITAGVKATLPQAHKRGHLPQACPPDTAHLMSGDVVIWPRPAGLAPVFPGLGELSAVSPEKELVMSHQWKGFTTFEGEPRKLWLVTWSPVSTPIRTSGPWPVLGTSLIGEDQGGEERRGVTAWRVDPGGL